MPTSRQTSRPDGGPPYVSVLGHLVASPSQNAIPHTCGTAINMPISASPRSGGSTSTPLTANPPPRPQRCTTSAMRYDISTNRYSNTISNAATFPTGWTAPSPTRTSRCGWKPGRTSWKPIAPRIWNASATNSCTRWRSVISLYNNTTEVTDEGRACRSLNSGAGRAALAAGRDAHVDHDAIQDDHGEIAVVGNTGKTTPPQEGVEAPIGRPVGIDGAEVARAQKFPREGVYVRIGQ